MDWQTIICNIVCSIIASIIFLFIILYVFKPKITIGSNIRKGVFYSGDPTEYYSFKFYNDSWFSAFDCHIELLEVDTIPTHHNNSYNERGIQLRMITKHITHIAPNWKTNTPNKYPNAITVRTKVDLESILKNELKQLRLKIILRHGLTGLSKVYTKNFAGVKTVKSGEFKTGRNFDII